MPGNIEIKAKVESLTDLKISAAALAEHHLQLEQCDIFFKTDINGRRIKMRKERNVLTGEGKACIIAYERPDVKGPKFSNYMLSPVTEPCSMEQALTFGVGAIGRVEKSRDVFIVRRNGLTARVHLDLVKDLGSFLEFEVIVDSKEEHDEGKLFAEYLCDYFGVSINDHVPGAYWNLLQEAGYKGN